MTATWWFLPAALPSRPARKCGPRSPPWPRRQARNRGALMSGFPIRNPYFIVVICLFIAVVGVTTLTSMPVDMFPAMNIPVVVVATFYSGMPPEQIETDITSRFERFFTLASGIDHIESRSLTGVSIIKVYFQPGSNADSADLDRNRYHQPLRTLFHPRQRHRPYRIPISHRRLHHQGLFPARIQCRFRRHQHLQPRQGAAPPPASRHSASRGLEVRCLQPARLSGDVQG